MKTRCGKIKLKEKMRRSRAEEQKQIGGRVRLRETGRNRPRRKGEWFVEKRIKTKLKTRAKKGSREDYEERERRRTNRKAKKQR
jgi:hypothetical protein